MALSRRRFLQASAAMSVATVAASTAHPHALRAHPATAQVAPSALPPLDVIALNRMGYGQRPGDLEAFQALGATPQAQLAAYVEQQLNPIDSADTLCNQKLQTVKLRIEKGSGASLVVEDRPLQNLERTAAELWALLRDEAMEGTEKSRPFEEIKAATWLRAIYSKWQLRELLIEFWHNHFNVNASPDERIRTTWPLYDKIMRQHCLGNFRAFLEDVAKSVAMMYYLDNSSNRRAGPNENFARELFELHTLGSDNYFNNLYDDWEKVPGAERGAPIGYVDDDVYEAARSFTGWTIADGNWAEGGRLPDTGEFTTVVDWHDRFEKRVLGAKIQNDQAPLKDGQQVLDLVAFHPATARHLCTKLCRRLVADDPPRALVDRAVQVWTANQRSPDQIKQTIRAILLAPEFASSWGQKVKHPFELFVSFLRATGFDVPPKEILDSNLLSSWYMDSTGYRLFSWPSPTGRPDDASYWLSTNSLLRRWGILNDMVDRGFWGLSSTDPLPFNARSLTPGDRQSSRQIVDFWVQQMLGRPLSAASLNSLVNFLRQDAGADVPPRGNDNDLNTRFNYLVTLIAMTPEFQWK